MKQHTLDTFLGALRSRTVWLNLVVLGLDVVNLLMPTNLVPPGTLTTLAAVGNIALRVLTTESLRDKTVRRRLQPLRKEE
jgi:hypothetical protein